MRVRSRILLGYSPVLALLAALLALAIVTSYLSDRAVNRAFDKTLPAIVAGEELLSLARNLEALEYVYFLAPVGKGRSAKAMAEFERASKEFDAYYASALAVAETPEDRRYLAEIDRAYDEFLAIDRQIRSLLAQGRLEPALRLNIDASLQAYERISRATSALVAYNRQLYMTSRKANQHQRNVTLAFVAGGGLLAMLLGLGIGTRLARGLAQPLAELERDADILAQGAFQLSGPSRAVQEITEVRKVYEALAWMARSLADLTHQLREANARLEHKVDERTADLREAKRALEATVEELRSLDKLKSDFLSVVSHELLTPINFVTGYGSTLSEGLLGELSLEQREAVDKMLEGAARLTRIVRNLLDFTRLESGELSIRPQAVEVGEIVEGVGAELASQFARKGIRFTVTLAPDVPPVMGDPARIQQVLGEVLDNAGKFTPSGGAIEVRVSHTPGAVEVEVTDTGVGIAPDVLPHVFERFYQGDSTSTRAYGGTGIGLTLAKHLVEAMGGEIAIESTLGEGASVTIRLPLAATLPG